MSGHRFYLEAYGCSASIADSEIIDGLLRHASFRSVERPEEADVNILVTCTVKTTTSLRMIMRIRGLNALNRPLIVAGCMPKTEKHLIEKYSPEASLIGPDSIDRAVEAVSAALRGERYVYTEASSRPKLLLPRVRRNPAVGIVETSSGCLGSCGFCQVKLAKGMLKSYLPEVILCEVKQALAEGCREVWLTSQDNGCYGTDIGSSLPEIIDRICKVEGDFKVRVGMMNPQHVKGMLEDLLNIYVDEKVFKFLHLPVQSGSDLVLDSMSRGHSAGDFSEIVKSFRGRFPLSTVSTDIIVGFPTEGEEDFQKTLSLIREVRPDIVNISRFGARPGTAAEKMIPLNPRVLKERSKELHRLVKEVAHLNNSRWIGWVGAVLIDEEVRGAVVGRNFAYRPIVIRREVPLGEVVKVRIVGATPSCLVGEPLT